MSGKKQYDRVFDALRFLRRTTMQDSKVGVRLVDAHLHTEQQRHLEQGQL